jgi:hypothetical protein
MVLIGPATLAALMPAAKPCLSTRLTLGALNGETIPQKANSSLRTDCPTFPLLSKHLFLCVEFSSGAILLAAMSRSCRGLLPIKSHGQARWRRHSCQFEMGRGWQRATALLGLQRVRFLNGFNRPNWHRFVAKRLKTLQTARTLNQRVQGSSPCAPTKQNQTFKQRSEGGNLPRKMRLGRLWEDSDQGAESRNLVRFLSG